MIARLLRGLGQAMITSGVVILLFVVYELFFTNLYTSREQSALRKGLTEQWAGPPAPDGQQPNLVAAELGNGIAVVRIPRLGTDYAEVVVEGVGVEDLKKGPGHLPGTAIPGAVGNFVVSGHRTTYGAPFNRLDEVRPGDAVVIETRDTYFTYRATAETVVDPSAVEVTFPVPGQPSAVPTQKLLTFTTCNPKYSASQRLILRAELADTTSKPGLPAALRG
ncbi:MAG: class E sortase [Actinomycetota bacterium]|nr:class E sortase [Actinomycetota bacterium]